MKKIILATVGSMVVAGAALGVKLALPSQATKVSSQTIGVFHSYLLPPVAVPSDLDAIRNDGSYTLQNDKVWNEFELRISSTWAPVEHSASASGDYIKAGGIETSPNFATKKLAHMIEEYIGNASLQTSKANDEVETKITESWLPFEFQETGNIQNLNKWKDDSTYPVIITNDGDSIFAAGSPTGILIANGRSWKRMITEANGDRVQGRGWAAPVENLSIVKDWQGRIGLNLPVYFAMNAVSNLNSDKFGPYVFKQYDDIMIYWAKISGYQPPQPEIISADFLQKLKAIPTANLPHGWTLEGFENPIGLLGNLTKITRYKSYFSSEEDLVVLSFPAPKMFQFSNYILLIKQSKKSIDFDPNILLSLQNTRPMVWQNGIYLIGSQTRFKMKDSISNIYFHKFTDIEPKYDNTEDTVDADGNNI